LTDRKIGVIGAGTMGNGIAHVFAQSGYEVVLHDIESAFVEKGMAAIDGNLQRGVDKGRMTAAEKAATLGRIHPTTGLTDLADCDLVVEAIVEKFEVKAAVFRQLDDLLGQQAIIASNTSSISITKMAAVTGRPDRFIGMHFMNPVPVMKLVEIIRGIATSDATYATVEELTKALGKVPVEVNDAPGFISNRVLLPMINEAIFALHEGVASAEAIDTVMKLGMNHPMGPFKLGDFSGLDIGYNARKERFAETGDPADQPAPSLARPRIHMA